MSKSRPFRGLLKPALARQAESAARTRDDITFDACIEELRERRRAEDLIEELLEFREGAHGRLSLPPLARAVASHDLAEVMVFTDDDCWSRGLELMCRANRTIWLSTYTLRDGTEELRETLLERVRANVDVRLIASDSRRANGGVAPQSIISELRRAGAHVFERTNHSKCIVVDGEYVIVGSANLQPMHWGDLCMQLRSVVVAEMITTFLERIAAS